MRGDPRNSSARQIDLLLAWIVAEMFMDDDPAPRDEDKAPPAQTPPGPAPTPRSR